MDVAEGDLIRQMLAVLLVFGLLGGAMWKLRGGAFPARSAGPRLSSMGRLALTPQHAVHLIQIDGRELVVATHPQGFSILSDTQEKAIA
jgi:flagellar biogenesis protein FliO